MGDQALHPIKAASDLLRKTGYRRCSKCGKVVSSRAFACRRCGKRQRINPRTLMLGLACLGMVGMFAVAVVGAMLSPSRASELGVSPVSSAAATATAGRDPVHVTAADLLSAYQHDAARADRLYKDKRIVVAGQVVAVPARDFQGNVLLRLGKADVLESVRVTLGASSSALAVRVSKGQTVSLVCTAHGALIGSPILSNCLL